MELPLITSKDLQDTEDIFNAEFPEEEDFSVGLEDNEKFGKSRNKTGNLNNSTSIENDESQDHENVISFDEDINNVLDFFYGNPHQLQRLINDVVSSEVKCFMTTESPLVLSPYFSLFTMNI